MKKIFLPVWMLQRSIYTPGCGDPPAPVCEDCPTKELGRIRHFWIQKSTYSFVDITSAAEWEQAICDGNVIVFPYSNGSCDQNPMLSEGYGNTPQTFDSLEYDIKIHEPQYKNNVPFWNFLKNGNSFKFGYCTQTLGHLSDVAATFIPTAPVGADVKSKIDMAINVKFVQEDLIVPFVYPQSILSVCQECV